MPGKPTNGRPVRALAVDDHPDTAESLCRLLEAMGCAATFVTDPAKAMQAAESLEADIIFLDIGMPGIDGFALARMFRKRYGEAIRLVAVTGYGSEADFRRSRLAGFDAHVKKPVDIRIVESMLKTVLPDRR